MVKPIISTRPQLFCEQFWAKKLKTATIVPEHISNEGLITGINGMLVGRDSDFCEALPNNILKCSNMTLPQMIALTDMEFKLLKPTTEKLTLWRGVGEPKTNNPHRISKFDKAYNSKVGDIITMPEYAFASQEFYYPKFIMRQATAVGSQRGILYKIEVPEGSKISKHTHYNFPRNSKFECTSIKDINDAEGNYRLIEIRYIKPEEP